MSKRAAIYLRVSTNDQTTQNQRRELEAIAVHSGWDVVEVFEDAGVSGAKGRDQRPAFDAMLRAATAREFDVVMAWSVDRLGRSLKDLVAFLDELRSLGADLYLHQQRLDTTTSSGRALFGMLSVFSEFERSLIQERVNAGLARAKAQGKKLGRPPVSEQKREKVLELRQQDMSFRAIAAEVGISASAAASIVREEALADGH